MSYDPGAYQYMNVLQNDKKNRKKKEDLTEKIINNMYNVCRKYGKSLDEITKNEVTKKEYKQLMDFLELRNINVNYYPNLQ